jgi:EAL domain-containing protein (putative c-di-GMP-specific phosphodiesterase class I)
LAPDEFVPLAEQTGLIKSLTMWVANRVIEEALPFCNEQNNLHVSINLSAMNLSDKGFAEELASLFTERGQDPRYVNLEITETALMDDPEQGMLAMQRLRDMGMMLSIDDFGTGYSSLSYLKQLPVTEVKIDKSFGLSLVNDGNSVVIVRSTIALAHELGLQVVTEGVESEDAYKLLERLGCDVVQGYYVAKPMPFEELLQWKKDSPL